MSRPSPTSYTTLYCGLAQVRVSVRVSSIELVVPYPELTTVVKTNDVDRAAQHCYVYLTSGGSLAVPVSWGDDDILYSDVDMLDIFWALVEDGRGLP